MQNRERSSLWSARVAFFPLSNSTQAGLSKVKQKHYFLINGGNYYRGCWDNKIQRKEEKFDMPQSRSPFTSSSTFTGTECLLVFLTYFCHGNVSPWRCSVQTQRIKVPSKLAMHVCVVNEQLSESDTLFFHVKLSRLSPKYWGLKNKNPQ